MLSLEEISDRLEIQQLLIDYSTAIDRREFDDLDAVFTPDAYIDYRVTGGIDGQYPQVKAWLDEVLPNFPAYSHMLGNCRHPHLAGDTATVTHDLLQPDGDGRRGGARSILSGIWYDDEFIRTARRLADDHTRREQVLRQDDLRPLRARAISARWPGCSGTMGGCLPRDYGPAAVTHVRQNRIRAIRPRSLNCSVAITGEVA